MVSVSMREECSGGVGFRCVFSFGVASWVGAGGKRYIGSGGQSQAGALRQSRNRLRLIGRLGGMRSLAGASVVAVCVEGIACSRRAR